jgi:hypothetical protein
MPRLSAFAALLLALGTICATAPPTTAASSREGLNFSPNTQSVRARPITGARPESPANRTARPGTDPEGRGCTAGFRVLLFFRPAWTPPAALVSALAAASRTSAHAQNVALAPAYPCQNRETSRWT